MPEPGWFSSGWGMKVAYWPSSRATSLTVIRNVVTASAIERASV